MSVIPNKGVDVLIIGAGAAGLAAAGDISAAGLRVAILEAGDRNGGGIYSHRDNSVQVPIELGAEYIYGKPPELLDLVESAGLVLCDVTDRHWYLRDCALAKAEECWDKFFLCGPVGKTEAPRTQSGHRAGQPATRTKSIGFAASLETWLNRVLGFLFSNKLVPI